MQSKGRPVIQDNGYGGCVYICPVGYKVRLLQMGIEGTSSGTVVEIRQEAEVNNTLEKLLRVLPGDKMDGEIIEYRQNSPVDDDDPLLHLIVRNGKAEWKWTEYVEEEL